MGGPVTALSADELQWRDTVRAFAADRIRPRVRAMDDAACLPGELLNELFATGMMGIEVPRVYGGAGLGLFEVVLAIEELARVDPAVAVLVDVQNALVISALARHGSSEQKRRYLPKLASGTVGAYAMSEAEAGSDALALRTVAVADGDGFALHGTKTWVTNAAEAGLFLVFARVPDHGVTAFLVEAGRPGVTVGPRIGKLGIRASSTCPVTFDGVAVDRHEVLGRVGDGEVLAVRTLTVGKLGIAAQLTGLAAGALGEAVDYAKNRQQFGVPIAEFQGVRFPLADAAAQTEAARVLVYNTARVLSSDDADSVTAAAIAKHVASVAADRVAALAVETLGGNGFSTRFVAEKFFRDAKAGKIYEGTANMQFRTISSALLGPVREAR